LLRLHDARVQGCGELLLPRHGFAQDPRRAERGALEVDEEPVEHTAARLDAFQEGLQHCRMPVQP